MAAGFLTKVGGGNFLQAALGGRECTSGFFNEKNQSLDVSTVCHDVRSLDLAPGEQAYVSVRDLRRREGEAFSQMGTACNLKALEFDTTLLLRVWVDEGSGSAGNGSSGERRVVGEVRIPLRRLIASYNGCLYHTWLTLESPGLQDSMKSIGGMAGDECTAFDQAVLDGPKQLMQPKACISVCRTQDIGPSGKIQWAIDAAPESRAGWWGPLLKSQQQHELLSGLLHQKCSHQATQLASSSPNPLLGLAGSSKQEEEIERLQGQLKAAQGELQQAQQHAHQHQQPSNSLFRTQNGVPCMPTNDLPPGRSGMGGLSITQAPGAARPVVAEASGYNQGASSDAQGRRLADAEKRLDDAEAQAHASATEAEEYRLELAGHREAAGNVQQELEKISSEANGKIEAANDRIRTLRHRRDEAEQELQQLKSTSIPLLEEEKATLAAENRQLSEQKEALLRIVEDLHQTCIAAGLNTAGRQSIDKTLTCSIPDLRSLT